MDEIKELLKQLEEVKAKVLEGKATAEQLEAAKLEVAELKKKIGDLEEKDKENDNLKMVVKSMQAQLDSMSEFAQGKIDGEKKNENTLEFKLKQNAEAIKEVATGKKSNASFDLDIKAAAIMYTSTAFVGNQPQANREPGFNRIATDEPTFFGNVNTIPTNSTVEEWVEQTTQDGVPVFIDEVTESTLISTKYEVKSSNVKEIAAHITIPTNKLEDIDGLNAELQNELFTKLRDTIDVQMYNGTESASNIKGISKYAVAFDAGGKKVASPTAVDVLIYAIAQIKKAKQGVPTVINVNPSMLAEMITAKDSTGKPLYPDLVFVNQVPMIRGVKLVESNLLGADEFFVGNLNKAHCKMRKTITIEFSRDHGDNFTKRLTTILATARLAFYVKGTEVKAFVAGTFTAAKTLLTA